MHNVWHHYSWLDDLDACVVRTYRYFLLPINVMILIFFFNSSSWIFLQHYLLVKLWTSTNRTVPLFHFSGSSFRKYINANIQHPSENGINVECHNPYSISFVYTHSTHTMMKRCRDLLAISVKRFPFTKYRYVFMCANCV